MATWSGWQADLLNAASLHQTNGNVSFLFEWNAHPSSNCANNPVDISRKVSGSTDCHKLTATRTAQRYGSHRSGASAFRDQIGGGNYPDLLRAMQSGDPLTTPRVQAMLDDLTRWGSLAFVAYLKAQLNLGGGGGGGGGQLRDAHALGGWADIRHSVNRNMPAALQSSSRTTRAALRRLGHARKVGH